MYWYNQQLTTGGIAVRLMTVWYLSIPLNAHDGVSSRATCKGLNFGLSLPFPTSTLSLCVSENMLARLRVSAGLSESSLLTNPISTEISCAGPYV